MAYTTFQKTFWSDDYTLKLNTVQKTVYIYIITNEKTTQCGIYELPIIKATTELGLSAEEFLLHLKKFNDDKKIQYSLETQEVAVINWLKHNDNLSWKSKEKVRKELINVKNPNLVVLLYDPRQPLYDGNRKKKVDGKFIEEIYVIDNPWKEVFASLTDEMLTEIRKPYIKSIALMPLTSPFNAPSMGDKAYTNSNSLQIHNITNSIQKQNTETANHMPVDNKPNYKQPVYENYPTNVSSTPVIEDEPKSIITIPNNISSELHTKFVEFQKYRELIKLPIKTNRPYLDLIEKIGTEYANEIHLIQCISMTMAKEWKHVMGDYVEYKHVTNTKVVSNRSDVEENPDDYTPIGSLVDGLNEKIKENNL